MVIINVHDKLIKNIIANEHKKCNDTMAQCNEHVDIKIIMVIINDHL
jgi:hypothetical protein